MRAHMHISWRRAIETMTLEVTFTLWKAWVRIYAVCISEFQLTQSLLVQLLLTITLLIFVVASYCHVK